MNFAEVGIPLFVAGELHFGAINSARRDHNLLLLDKAVAKFPVIFPDAATIPIYASIRHGLRVKGRPIPENDVWIAALAGRHDIPVITRDAHFQSIDGLRLETW